MSNRFAALLAGAVLLACIVGFTQEAPAPPAAQAVLDPLQAAYQTNKERCANQAERVACEGEALSQHARATRQAKIKRARDDYAVARQACATLSADEKSACVRHAKAVRRKAKAEAEASVKALQDRTPRVSVAAARPKP